MPTPTLHLLSLFHIPKLNRRVLTPRRQDPTHHRQSSHPSLMPCQNMMLLPTLRLPKNHPATSIPTRQQFPIRRISQRGHPIRVPLHRMDQTPIFRRIDFHQLSWTTQSHKSLIGTQVRRQNLITLIPQDGDPLPSFHFPNHHSPRLPSTTPTRQKKLPIPTKSNDRRKSLGKGQNSQHL